MENKMKKLGERNYTLLSMGARTMGDWEGAYSYVEEQMYVCEAREIYAFCEWLDAHWKEDEKNGVEDWKRFSMGVGNYEKRFSQFQEEVARRQHKLNSIALEEEKSLKEDGYDCWDL